jgi:hypothetical protein
MKRETIARRLDMGWSEEMALMVPVKGRGMNFDEAMTEACQDWQTSVESVAKACSVTLNEAQRKATTGWLKSDSDRTIGTGRTTFLALHYVRKAFDTPGRPVPLFDHHTEAKATTRVLIPVVRQFAENFAGDRGISPGAFRFTATPAALTYTGIEYHKVKS